MPSEQPDKAIDVTRLPPNENHLASLTAIAEEAGQIALGYYRPGATTRAEIEWKGDGSPVTEADFAVNAFLERRLRALFPKAAWLSEESVDDQTRLGAPQVLIVDPIDGTRGFARGEPHWAVAVALVEDGRPVIGVVHAPALAETYAARAGAGATLNGAALAVADVALPDLRDLRVTCPGGLAKALRSIGADFAFQPKIASLALRVAKVAAGVYDAGLTAGQSHDWDIAAADLVLAEAGGLICGLDGRPVAYNKPDPSHGVLAASAPRLQETLRQALRRTGDAR
jgi:myo-inositol-1(or 4)-monophosphatase